MNGLKWKPVVVAVAAVAVFVPRLAAQAREVGELPELTLEQAVRNTLAKHPVLRQAQLDIGSAELRVRRARSDRLVQIDAGGLGKRGLSGSANSRRISFRTYWISGERVTRPTPAGQKSSSSASLYARRKPS